jgi:hypothetical protein
LFAISRRGAVAVLLAQAVTTIFYIQSYMAKAELLEVGCIPP